MSQKEIESYAFSLRECADDFFKEHNSNFKLSISNISTVLLTKPNLVTWLNDLENWCATQKKNKKPISPDELLGNVSENKIIIDEFFIMSLLSSLADESTVLSSQDFEGKMQLPADYTVGVYVNQNLPLSKDIYNYLRDPLNDSLIRPSVQKLMDLRIAKNKNNINEYLIRNPDSSEYAEIPKELRAENEVFNRCLIELMQKATPPQGLSRGNC